MNISVERYPKIQWKQKYIRGLKHSKVVCAPLLAFQVTFANCCTHTRERAGMSSPNGHYLFGFLAPGH